MICSKHVDSAAQFAAWSEASWAGDPAAASVSQFHVMRKNFKVNKQTHHPRPSPCSPTFLSSSLSCTCPEFMLICTCLCPVSGTCGRACPGERAGTCFAVCFWQDKHKAQDEERGKRREREQCMKFVCVATLPGKQLPKVVFQDT